jgi:hypothetical protein
MLLLRQMRQQQDDACKLSFPLDSLVGSPAQAGAM